MNEEEDRYVLLKTRMMLSRWSLVFLVLSRGQEIMAAREAKIQSCHDFDDLLQGGLDG